MSELRKGLENTTETFDLYLMESGAASPTITTMGAVGSLFLQIDSNIGVSAGDAIYITEGTRFFQSVVVSSTATSVTFVSPLDYAFTSAATVKIGAWNMNLNGSATPVTFLILPPPGAVFLVHTISISMLDNKIMDGTTFGGLSALNNGVVMMINNISKTFLPVVNNSGFAETGFDVFYDDKAPTGEYAFRAVKDLIKRNGAAIRLDSADFRNYIQDDLTGLTNINITLSGRIE